MNRFLENFGIVVVGIIVGLLAGCALATPTILAHIFYGNIAALIVCVVTIAACVAATITYEQRPL